ncbi:MAG TPA: SRPBCC family protein [Nitrososphaera sp.]
MLHFKNKLEINPPIDDIFLFISNFQNMPKWNYFVLEVTKLSEGSIGLNTTFRQVRKTDTHEYKITEFEPNRRVTIETFPPYSKLVMRFTFEQENNHTILTDEWELDTSKPALVEKLAGGNVKSVVAENLQKLKQLLETGKVTLQDGRTATFTKLLVLTAVKHLTISSCCAQNDPHSCMERDRERCFVYNHLRHFSIRIVKLYIF